MNDQAQGPVSHPDSALEAAVAAARAAGDPTVTVELPVDEVETLLRVTGNELARKYPAPWNVALRIVCRSCQKRAPKTSGEIARIEMQGSGPFVYCDKMPRQARFALTTLLEYEPTNPSISDLLSDGWWPTTVTFNCRCGDSIVPTARLLSELQRFRTDGKTRVLAVR